MEAGYIQIVMKVLFVNSALVIRGKFDLVIVLNKDCVFVDIAGFDEAYESVKLNGRKNLRHQLNT